MKNKIFYSLPRVLVGIYLVFISMFALDELGNGLGFIIHLIPSFIVLAAAIYAWRREFIGGVIFIILGIVFALYYRNLNAFIVACAPILIIGLLFMYQSQYNKKDHKD